MSTICKLTEACTNKLGDYSSWVIQKISNSEVFKGEIKLCMGYEDFLDEGNYNPNCTYIVFGDVPNNKNQDRIVINHPMISNHYNHEYDWCQLSLSKEDCYCFGGYGNPIARIVDNIIYLHIVPNNYPKIYFIYELVKSAYESYIEWLADKDAYKSKSDELLDNYLNEVTNSLLEAVENSNELKLGLIKKTTRLAIELENLKETYRKCIYQNSIAKKFVDHLHDFVDKNYKNYTSKHKLIACINKIHKIDGVSNVFPAGYYPHISIFVETEQLALSSNENGKEKLCSLGSYLIGITNDGTVYAINKCMGVYHPVNFCNNQFNQNMTNRVNIPNSLACNSLEDMPDIIAYVISTLRDVTEKEAKELDSKLYNFNYLRHDLVYPTFI